jgi:hypothetical protein
MRESRRALDQSISPSAKARSILFRVRSALPSKNSAREEQVAHLAVGLTEALDRVLPDAGEAELVKLEGGIEFREVVRLLSARYLLRAHGDLQPAVDLRGIQSGGEFDGLPHGSHSSYDDDERV